MGNALGMVRSARSFRTYTSPSPRSNEDVDLQNIFTVVGFKIPIQPFPTRRIGRNCSRRREGCRVRYIPCRSGQVRRQDLHFCTVQGYSASIQKYLLISRRFDLLRRPLILCDLRWRYLVR
ncbi:hypothetical protein OF83DRAFT_262506 [Amylostereum chailletii]|nr:hypothetical protein OF83DRAFT_262506 [Amylostereum chailletii]